MKIIHALKVLCLPASWLFWFHIHGGHIHFHPNDGPVACTLQFMLWTAITAYIVSIPLTIISVATNTDDNGKDNGLLTSGLLPVIFLILTVITVVLCVKNP